MAGAIKDELVGLFILRGCRLHRIESLGGFHGGLGGCRRSPATFFSLAFAYIATCCWHLFVSLFLPRCNNLSLPAEHSNKVMVNRVRVGDRVMLGRFHLCLQLHPCLVGNKGSIRRSASSCGVPTAVAEEVAVS